LTPGKNGLINRETEVDRTGANIFAEQRQQRIAEQARLAGRVDVAALAAELEVTAETVRRDLTALERQGVLRRVHGGAIPFERLGFEPGLAARDTVRRAEKERIAKAALAELPVEGSVLIDAGTTTARLTEALPANRELTVVTNALPIALTLSVRPGLTVLMVGGRVRGRTQAAVDDWALRALGDTYVDVAFVGTNGISIDRGLTTPDPGEAAVKRAMLAAARRVVVLADHTKVGATHFARFGGLTDVDMLITDSGLDADVAARLEAAGPTVVRA
jgi:DeoR family fructose operon transcriptional repressor